MQKLNIEERMNENDNNLNELANVLSLFFEKYADKMQIR